MRLTPWYPAHTRPVRVGVYNASQFFNEHIYRYWDGEWWSYCDYTPRDCLKVRDKKCPVQELARRGIARKAGKKK